MLVSELVFVLVVVLSESELDGLLVVVLSELEGLLEVISEDVFDELTEEFSCFNLSPLVAPQSLHVLGAVYVAGA